jgi:predicted HicB family RNase H-like nuclease
MSKPEEYGICIRLIRQDDTALFEGRVNELPDLKVYCDTQAEAYEELVDAIQTAQALFEEQGREFPQVEPSEETFSGRVTLRMSRSLHRCVHERAERDGVSLNQWIVEAVASRTDKRMVPADSVLVASQGRAEGGGTQTMFLQTHFLATVSMGARSHGQTFNIFGVPGFHEAVAHTPVVAAVGNARPRITNG